MNKKALQDSAQMYESILSKVPNDEYSLEELIKIYEQLEDEEKLKLYKDSLEKARKGEKIEFKIATSKPSPTSTVIRQRNKNKTIKVSSRPVISEPVPTKWQNPDISLSATQILRKEGLITPIQSPSFSMKPQVDLMIILHALNLINDEQFCHIMYELSEHKFIKNPEKPYMIVHLLEECKGINLSLIHNFLAQKFNMPYLEVGGFQRKSEIISLFPKQMIYNQGIAVFKKLKECYCICVLNPVDKDLLEQVEKLMDKPIQFF